MKCVHSFVLIAIVGSVSSNSEVMESSSFYSCCSNLTVQFNQHCENIWSIYDKPIAYSKGSKDVPDKCIPPCKKMKDGQMMLSACVDLNATVVCTEMNVTVEKRIYYYVEPCPESFSNAAGTQGSLDLLVLALVITAWFVKC